MRRIKQSVPRTFRAAVGERQRSAGENGASDLHFKETSERHFRSVASLGSSGFGDGFVLVLSIAVLVLSIAVLVLSIAVLVLSIAVLVLETLLGYSVGSLYQSSEHRHDPF
jgi:hypothetical protein